MRLSPLENKFTVNNPCIVKCGPLNHTFLPIAFDFADCNVIKMRKFFSIQYMKPLSMKTFLSCLAPVEFPQYQCLPSSCLDM